MDRNSIFRKSMSVQSENRGGGIYNTYVQLRSGSVENPFDSACSRGAGAGAGESIYEEMKPQHEYFERLEKEQRLMVEQTQHDYEQLLRDEEELAGIAVFTPPPPVQFDTEPMSGFGDYDIVPTPVPVVMNPELDGTQIDASCAAHSDVGDKQCTSSSSSSTASTSSGDSSVGGARSKSISSDKIVVVPDDQEKERQNERSIGCNGNDTVSSDASTFIGTGTVASRVNMFDPNKPLSERSDQKCQSHDGDQQKQYYYNPHNGLLTYGYMANRQRFNNSIHRLGVNSNPLSVIASEDKNRGSSGRMLQQRTLLPVPPSPQRQSSSQPPGRFVQSPIVDHTWTKAPQNTAQLQQQLRDGTNNEIFCDKEKKPVIKQLATVHRSQPLLNLADKQVEFTRQRNDYKTTTDCMGKDTVVDTSAAAKCTTNGRVHQHALQQHSLQRNKNTENNGNECLRVKVVENKRKDNGQREFLIDGQPYRPHRTPNTVKKHVTIIPVGGDDRTARVVTTNNNAVCGTAVLQQQQQQPFQPCPVKLQKDIERYAYEKSTFATPVRSNTALVDLTKEEVLLNDMSHKMEMLMESIDRQNRRIDSIQRSFVTQPQQKANPLTKAPSYRSLDILAKELDEDVYYKRNSQSTSGPTIYNPSIGSLSSSTESSTPSEEKKRKRSLLSCIR